MKKIDWRKRIRRLQFNLRRSPVTLVGDAGKPYRAALAVAAGLLLVLILALASREEPQLMASAELLAIQDRGVLRVGVRQDVPGLNGPGGGLEQALAQRLAERVLPDADPSTCLQLVPVNAMTLGTKLDDGSVDAAIAMAAQPMAGQYSYSVPYYSDPCLLVALAGTPNFALENMEVGVVQSNGIRKSPELLLFQAYSAAHQGQNLKERTYASYPDMLDALARGDVRAVLLTELYASVYAEAYPIAATAFSFGTVDYAVCSPSDAPALASVATLLLQELQASGELASLYAAHGLNPARLPLS